ncbi:type I-D CRISPR-associated helicase Cas3' [Spirulina sp. 06S082]|uniref:type I-D CRISPR-associated helicase Cas3' n=1 Tax=Spirulina sp. 06S082 TaxID=3110248 RepID=UPI002B220B4D|nr:type I-D CRISPR-associated helicase Cas3' [Spirulina sp. 06S082]MEA5468309.1 type I-D CRISPR-associated helicase Cas3' [Spirulina sp. 06S082]
MKIELKPLFSQLNAGIGDCPLGCNTSCLVRECAPALKPPSDYTCPLSSHQAQTHASLTAGNADIIFNTSATGDGKSLAASLPSLLDRNFRMMGLYPTIELVEDQTEQQKSYHKLFGLEPEERIDRLFGAELSRRVEELESNRFQELLFAIQTKPILLASPDLLHYITHFRYRDPAYALDLLPLSLAEFPDVWVFDEFHIFGAHQEAAVLNSLALIRRTQQKPRRFLFTSATPKFSFIEQLKKADFNVIEIEGIYASEATPGYRPILQPASLEFVELKENSVLNWLVENAPKIANLLETEAKGRGLIILNSVAMVNRVVRQLQTLLPEVEVREISGRIDRLSRRQTQTVLQKSDRPVLVVATSAVDVGVDFKIHLLICESSDAATVVQRLGRLGRHSGFSAYHAFVLISGRVPWVMARLQEKLTAGQSVDRQTLRDAIEEAFASPREFAEYRNCWGSLQARGMLDRMAQENQKVSQNVRDRMSEDFRRIYGNKLDATRKRWYALGRIDTGKAIRNELLRFRGSSALQGAVWDGDRFYTYDLLRLLPYALVELCDRQTFLNAAMRSGHGEEEFPKPHIHVYLKIIEWLDERCNLSFACDRDSRELKTGQLSLIDNLIVIGHPQSEVESCLSQREILTFLVPVDRNNKNSHWQVSRHLHLNPLFGLYRLTDGAKQAYACAFNHDALLLNALNWRLKKFYQTQPQSLIF